MAELKITTPPEAAKVFNTRTVGSMTTYEIRQELERRNCMDIRDDKINHNSLLERLIQELVKDEQAQAESRVESELDKVNQERAAAKAEREKKKAEALARSKARQQDPAYFEALKQKNEAVKKEREEKMAAAAAAGMEAATEGEEEEEEETGGDVDPFRSYQSKGNSKIFIR